MGYQQILKFKNITKKEWHEAKNAAKKITSYKKNIREILKLDQTEVVKNAKIIDAFEKNIQQEGEENITAMEARKTLIAVRKLPGYKDYIKSLLLSYFPNLKMQEAMIQLEELKKGAKAYRKKVYRRSQGKKTKPRTKKKTRNSI